MAKIQAKISSISSEYIEVSDYFTTYQGCEYLSTNFYKNGNRMLGTPKHWADYWVGEFLPYGDANGNFTWVKKGTKPSFKYTIRNFITSGDRDIRWSSSGLKVIGGAGEVLVPSSDFSDKTSPENIIVCLQGAGGGGGSGTGGLVGQGGTGGGGGGFCYFVLRLKKLFLDGYTVRLHVGKGGTEGREGGSGSAGESTHIEIIKNGDSTILVSAWGGGGGQGGVGPGGSGGQYSFNDNIIVGEDLSYAEYYDKIGLISGKNGGDGGSNTQAVETGKSVSGIVLYSTNNSDDQSEHPNFQSFTTKTGGGIGNMSSGGGASLLANGGKASWNANGTKGEKGSGGGGGDWRLGQNLFGGDGGDGVITLYY